MVTVRRGEIPEERGKTRFMTAKLWLVSESVKLPHPSARKIGMFRRDVNRKSLLKLLADFGAKFQGNSAILARKDKAAGLALFLLK